MSVGSEYQPDTNSLVMFGGDTWIDPESPLGKLDETQLIFLDNCVRYWLVNRDFPAVGVLRNSMPALSDDFYNQQLNNLAFLKAVEYEGFARYLPHKSQELIGYSILAATKELVATADNSSAGRVISENPDDAVPLLTRQQLRFLSAVLDPHETRNIRAVLKQLGLTTKTYQNWLKDPVFRNYYYSQARQLLGERIPEVKTALVKKAVAGDFNSMKLVFEMTGEWTDKPTEQFNPRWFIGKVLDSLQRNVKDIAVLENVANELAALLEAVTNPTQLVVDEPPLAQHTVISGATVIENAPDKAVAVNE